MRAITCRYNGSRVRDILRAQGRRQDWLARKTGLSTTHVSHILSGRRTVSHEAAERIAAALEVPFFLAFESPIGNDSSPTGLVASEVAA